MSKEFEKSKHEEWNKRRFLRKVHTWLEGADWAYEWFANKTEYSQMKLFSDLEKMMHECTEKSLKINELKKENHELKEKIEILNKMPEGYFNMKLNDKIKEQDEFILELKERLNGYK